MHVHLYYVCHMKGMIDIRRSFIYPVSAAVLGIIGAVLRKVELSTVFESSTGLARRGEPITIALAVFSVASAALFIVLSSRIKKYEVSEGYLGAMTNGSQALFAVSVVSAFGIACGSVLYYFEGRALIDIILTVFGLIASMAVFILSRVSSKSSESDGNAALSALFVVFICLLLVLEYKARSADPELLDYVYDFLALCSAALAFYYKAGYAFSKPKPRRSIMYMQLSLYFCIIAVPGASGLSRALLFTSLALLLIRDIAVLAGNLKESH